jgi:hypothetical protein
MGLRPDKSEKKEFKMPKSLNTNPTYKRWDWQVMDTESIEFFSGVLRAKIKRFIYETPQ